MPFYRIDQTAGKMNPLIAGAILTLLPSFVLRFGVILLLHKRNVAVKFLVTLSAACEGIAAVIRSILTNPGGAIHTVKHQRCKRKLASVAYRTGETVAATTMLASCTLASFRTPRRFNVSLHVHEREVLQGARNSIPLRVWRDVLLLAGRILARTIGVCSSSRIDRGVSHHIKAVAQAQRLRVDDISIHQEFLKNLRPFVLANF
mmetsp:Transcript_39344/g.80700  ORF Transcript_39344/g.80700 Transcript_39344/m.80700 type:complete len:204 (+) Transcript_39344:629-1240(+)